MVPGVTKSRTRLSTQHTHTGHSCCGKIFGGDDLSLPFEEKKLPERCLSSPLSELLRRAAGQGPFPPLSPEE